MNTGFHQSLFVRLLFATAVAELFFVPIASQAQNTNTATGDYVLPSKCTLVAPAQPNPTDEAQTTSAPRINPANGMLFITGVRSRINVATGEVETLPIDHASFYRTQKGEVVSLHFSSGGGFDVVMRDAQYNIAEIVARAVKCTARDIPVLSPDGHLVAFVEWATGTSIYSRAGKYLGTLPGMQPTDWTPDGRLLLVGFPRTNPGVYLTSPDLRSIKKINPVKANWASASPDGKRIAYEVDSRVYAMNTDGDNVVALTTGVIAQRPVWSPDGKWLAVRSLKPYEYTPYKSSVELQAVFLLNPNTPLQQELTPLKQVNGLPVEIRGGVMQWR